MTSWIMKSIKASQKYTRFIILLDKWWKNVKYCIVKWQQNTRENALFFYLFFQIQVIWYFFDPKKIDIDTKKDDHHQDTDN